MPERLQVPKTQNAYKRDFCPSINLQGQNDWNWQRRKDEVCKNVYSCWHVRLRLQLAGRKLTTIKESNCPKSFSWVAPGLWVQSHEHIPCAIQWEALEYECPYTSKHENNQEDYPGDYEALRSQYFVCSTQQSERLTLYHLPCTSLSKKNPTDIFTLEIPMTKIHPW